MDDFPGLGSDADNSFAAEAPARDARRAELRAAVKQGLVDIEEGRVVDLGEALDRIEAMLDELEADKRSRLRAAVTIATISPPPRHRPDSGRR